MQKQNSDKPVKPLAEEEQAAEQDEASRTSEPNEPSPEDDLVRRGARGAAIGGLLGGGGGAAVGGIFGLVGGVLGEDRKKSRW